MILRKHFYYLSLLIKSINLSRTLSSRFHFIFTLFLLISLFKLNLVCVKCFVLPLDKLQYAMTLRMKGRIRSQLALSIEKQFTNIWNFNSFSRQGAILRVSNEVRMTMKLRDDECEMCKNKEKMKMRCFCMVFQCDQWVFLNHRCFVHLFFDEYIFNRFWETSSEFY